MGNKNSRRNQKKPTSPVLQAVSPDHELKGLELQRQMHQMTNMMVSGIVDQMATTSSGRSALAQRLGYEYQGDRDVYTALGYIKELQFADYMARFRRGDISRRIISAPVKETWRNVPIVNEIVDDEKDVQERTAFEKAWDKLAQNKTLKLFHNLRKTDMVSGIGLWGAMFLGFADVDDQIDFSNPVEPGAKLIYLTPLNEEQAQISTTVNDATDERFGMPEFYQVQFSSTVVQQVSGAGKMIESAKTQSIRVHWSRMIHVAEEAEDDGTVGTPRLQAVFNRLMDMDRVVGGTGESFWRNAFPGMQFKLDPDFQTTDEQDLNELRTTIDSFVHRWERYVRTSGITIEQLEVQVAPPKQSFEVILSIIAGTTEIPQRILVGSERGELSSSQDATQWGATIEERREQHVEPVILDQFILRMIKVGILPEASSWSYVWPDILTPSDKDKAEVAAKRTEALVKYADSIAAGEVVPLNVFLRSDKFMGFSEEEAMKIEEELGTQADENMLTIEEEARRITEEDAARRADEALQLTRGDDDA